MRISYILKYMERDTHTKNYEPTVRQDKGPNETIRNKDRFGRYTANPNFQGGKEQVDKEWKVFEAHKFNDLPLPTMFYKDVEQKEFDKKISIPFFEHYFDKTIGFMQNYNGFVVASNFEDVSLGVDYFIRRKDRPVDTKHAFMLFNDQYTTLDLKTMLSGLGDRDFYNKPNLSLTIRKVIAPKKEGDTYIHHNQLEKHLSSRYAIQIPYSSKSKNASDFTINDIEECKMYFMKSSIMKNAIANHNEIVMDKCMEQFNDFLNKSDIEIKQGLKEIALANGYDCSYELGEDGNSRFRLKGINEEFLFKIINNSEVQGLIIFPMKEFDVNPNVAKKAFFSRDFIK